MPTVYPGAIDTFTNPAPTDRQDAPGATYHPDQHANVNDAAEAIETKLGITGSADVNSIDYKVTQLLLHAIQTIAENDGSPSLQRKLLRVAGTLTDVDANTALLEWAFLQLKDVNLGTFTGKGGWAIQVRGDELGIEAVAPWDVTADPARSSQLVITQDVPNAQVIFTVNPPAPVSIPMIGAPLTNVVAIGSATAEWPNNQRRKRVDLTNATKARAVVTLGGTAFTAGTLIGVQYSLDKSTWIYLDAATGPAAAASTTNDVVASGWVDITALARADVYLRLVGRGGTGAVEGAIIGGVELQVK